MTIVIVTHNMQQAPRVSEYCAFFLVAEGEPGGIVEHGTTQQIFDEPDGPADRRLRARAVRMSRARSSPGASLTASAAIAIVVPCVATGPRPRDGRTTGRRLHVVADRARRSGGPTWPAWVSR